ncbi:hypothetical protein O5853_30790, partial [Escherichia coli]|nr:hypothetical protein [Escherichia coli]
MKIYSVGTGGSAKKKKRWRHTLFLRARLFALPIIGTRHCRSHGMEAAGKPTNKPNLVCGPVQICWH